MVTNAIIKTHIEEAVSCIAYRISSISNLRSKLYQINVIKIFDNNWDGHTLRPTIKFRIGIHKPETYRNDRIAGVTKEIAEKSIRL